LKKDPPSNKPVTRQARKQTEKKLKMNEKTNLQLYREREAQVTRIALRLVGEGIPYREARDEAYSILIRNSHSASLKKEPPRE